MPARSRLPFGNGMPGKAIFSRIRFRCTHDSCGYSGFAWICPRTRRWRLSRYIPSTEVPAVAEARNAGLRGGRKKARAGST